MQRELIINAIEIELQRNKKIFPAYPDHMPARAAIVAKQSGALISAALKYKYEPAEEAAARNGQLISLQRHAIESAAAAIRFLENLNDPE